jgi:hypothetical protein
LGPPNRQATRQPKLQRRFNAMLEPRRSPTECALTSREISRSAIGRSVINAMLMATRSRFAKRDDSRPYDRFCRRPVIAGTKRSRAQSVDIFSPSRPMIWRRLRACGCRTVSTIVDPPLGLTPHAHAPAVALGQLGRLGISQEGLSDADDRRRQNNSERNKALVTRNGAAQDLNCICLKNKQKPSCRRAA